MSQKLYLLILKVGIFLSLISVFLVSNKLLFPFITSKQIYFNILIEILAIFWLTFIIKYPEYRPKKNWITLGLVSFFIAITLSSFFSVDFNLSFWGDVERMLGVFHLLHFFLFYLIIITVFREWKDWRILFISSIATAIIITLYSLFKIAYSTIGNTAYVSGYIIFNVYFALILFFRQRREEKNNKTNWLIGSLYVLAILIMLSVMSVTHTRGAYMGLGISFFTLLLLFLILPKQDNLETINTLPKLKKHNYQASKFPLKLKSKKIYFLSTMVVMAILISLIFTFPNSALVQKSSILRTITQISLKAATFQTRFISWKTAIKDFPNHPIFGTGHGNFAITFDKYFDPKFYDYTTSETYFDRAHNNLIDITSTTGLAGLFTYISIFVATFYYLIKGFKKKKIETTNFILITCLFIAYFIQNLVVFDSLVTYLALIITLAYVYWLTDEEKINSIVQDQELNNKEILTFVTAGLIMLLIIFQYNFKPWQMLKGTIEGQYSFSRGDMIAGIQAYKKALSYKTVLDRDSRASLINTVNANSNLLSGLDKQRVNEILDFVIKAAEENVKLNPRDSMMQMQLALILNTASAFHTDKANEFYFYSDRALEAINKSIEASPGRVTIYFTKAQIYTMRNEKDKAIETLKYGLSLNTRYNETYCYLAKIYIYYQEEKEGYKTLDRCLDYNGENFLAPADFIKIVIKHYESNKDYPRLIKLYERLSQLEADPKIWVNLSLIYAQQGKIEKAVGAANKASQLDPALKKSADEFIEKLVK